MNGFSILIFLSAFLLFLVQPIIAKHILPWFGGTPSVWATCMCFFQAALFLGYAYAHLIKRLKLKTQIILHCALLITALYFLPIAPNEALKPTGTVEPAWLIFKMLLMAVGVPYFLVSTTNPLTQFWFSKVFPDRSPYRLYALSNLGSFLALLSYPFLIEPSIDVMSQESAWSLGFCLFAVDGVILGIWIIKQPLAETQSVTEIGDTTNTTSPYTLLPYWLGLTICSSVLVIAVTNFMCQDIAVVPLLWILPLAIYLLTFILCFESSRWYHRRLYLLSLICVAIGLILANQGFIHAGTEWQILLCVSLLFVACMICHGELAELKPAPKYLTLFYLAGAFGGMVGGVFVVLIAPHIFVQYSELPLGLELLVVIVFALVLRDDDWLSHIGVKGPALAKTSLAIVCGMALFITFRLDRSFSAIYASRNFFGILRVLEEDKTDASQWKRRMYHGAIEHGFQYLNPVKSKQPTAYFGRSSGVGKVLTNFSSQSPRKIGVIGLGAGTLLSYGKPGDNFAIYEINPDVVDAAEKLFTYMRDSSAHYQVTVGDARLSLEREQPNGFDILIVDAFSGDSIPVHLITEEAFELYLRHINDRGIIVLQLSNRYLDLRPVVAKAAEKLGLHCQFIGDPANPGEGTYLSLYAALTRSPDTMKMIFPEYQNNLIDGYAKNFRLWTDRYSNLFSVLR